MQRFTLFLNEQLILESFSDAKRIWSINGNDNDKIDEYIKLFKELKDKNQLSGEQKDISYWIKKDFDVFMNFIDRSQVEYELKSLSKVKSNERVKVFENDKCVVYNILTHNAACKYGAGTRWCITQSNDDHWISYHEQNHVNFYFIIQKNLNIDNRLYKIAVAVYPEKMNTTEIFDATDTRLYSYQFEGILEDLEIDETIFQPKEIFNYVKAYNEHGITKELKQKVEDSWKHRFDHEIVWKDDKTGSIYQAKDLSDFIIDYGNDTANWIIKILDGEDYLDINIPYEGNINDLYDMLDGEKVKTYLEENYPDEEEWENDYFEFIKDQKDELWDILEICARYGEEAGAQNEMVEYLNKALKNFDIYDSVKYEFIKNGAMIDIDKKWDTPLPIWCSFLNMCIILNDYEVEYIKFEIEVSAPYYGFSGYDEETAKDYFKGEKFGYMLKD